MTAHDHELRTMIAVGIGSILLAGAVVAGMLVIVPQPLTPHVVLTGPYVASRTPNTYRFEPKPDITAYELALSLGAMFGSVDYLARMQPYYDAMPPSVRRHWLPLSPPAAPSEHGQIH